MKAVTALVPLLALGCIQTHVARLSPTRYEPKPAATPIAIYSAQLPSCPFSELAIVNASRDTWLVSHDAAIDALREKARKLGGDALVRVVFDEQNAITGTVIRFDRDDCKQ